MVVLWVEDPYFLEGGKVQVRHEVKTRREGNDVQSEEDCTGGQGDGVCRALNQDARETRWREAINTKTSR